MSQVSRRQFALRALGTGVAMGTSPSLLRAADWFMPQAGPGLSGRTASDPYANVDPDLLPPLKAFTTLTFDPQVLATVRKLPNLPALPAPAPQPVERMIPGPPGAPAVKVYIVDPQPTKKDKPVLLHTHGGGYIAANAALFPFIQSIASDCNCVVVSVDYRLAPETRFPGSLDDNYTALRWVYDNAASLGIDRSRIAVGGESAGGGHAAALAIRARDRGEVPVVFQLLIYPMLDDRTGSRRKVPAGIGDFVWTAASNRFGWSSLLGVAPGSSHVPAGAVPARVESVAGLPAAFIGVGSIDLFVREDVAYGLRLMQAMVSTELFVVPGAYHGFDLLAPGAPVSKRFTDTWKAALRKAFA